MHLDDTNLELFMQNFLGYGNLASDFWFVGMEEGGGNSFEEINARLNHWIAGGPKELEDVADYHEKFGMGYFFADKPKNQSTWNKLIRIILAIKGDNFSLEDVKTFQKSKLARNSSNNCLIELFPLPSPSATHWLYSEFSNIEYLGSRTLYKETLVSLRVKNIRHKIDQYRPKVVVFYGINSEYRRFWSLVANAEFKHIDIEGKSAFIAENAGTFFIIVTHPVSTGITNEYFHKIGKLASIKLAS